MPFKRKDGKPISATRRGTCTHTVRTKDGGTKTLKYGKKLAIYLTCTECLGWEVHPDDCSAKLCPLFPFRGRTLASHKGDK